jgi:restriction endonuclease S subunit
MEKVLSNQTFGTAVQHLRMDVLKNFPIPVPSLEEQQKAIEELNNIRKMIKNSEENTKTLKNALSLSLSLSLSYEKETKIKKLGEIATFEYGNYDGKGEDKGKYKLVRITDLDEYGNISEKNLKYTDLSKEFKTNKFLSKGDIVVSRQAFPARVGIFEEEKAVLSSNLVKVKFNKELLLPKYFL